jgi:hypothetical protein
MPQSPPPGMVCAWLLLVASRAMWRTRRARRTADQHTRVRSTCGGDHLADCVLYHWSDMRLSMKSEHRPLTHTSSQSPLILWRGMHASVLLSSFA